MFSKTVTVLQHYVTSVLKSLQIVFDSLKMRDVELEDHPQQGLTNDSESRQDTLKEINMPLSICCFLAFFGKIKLKG